jgi:hypothetical protein
MITTMWSRGRTGAHNDTAPDRDRPGNKLERRERREGLFGSTDEDQLAVGSKQGQVATQGHLRAGMVLNECFC